MYHTFERESVLVEDRLGASCLLAACRPAAVHEGEMDCRSWEVNSLVRHEAAGGSLNGSSHLQVLEGADVLREVVVGMFLELSIRWSCKGAASSVETWDELEAVFFFPLDTRESHAFHPNLSFSNSLVRRYL